MKAIIPAIDISNGRCVRLTQGKFSAKKVYNQDPVELAKQYVAYGAKRIHLVDLDAAFRIGNNRAVISDICVACAKDCVIEVGGGIRNADDIKFLLDMGVDRLCLGTMLARDVFQIIHWINKFGKVFIGSLDVSDNKVQITGWQEDSEVEFGVFLDQIKEVQLCSIQFTNIIKDGMLAGVDLETATTIAKIAQVPVILSGGLGNLEELDQIMNNSHDNIVGVVVGKAFLEGVINLEEAFKKYPSPDCFQW